MLIMKQFLLYFVLEFIIIFVVGSAGYLVLQVPLNLPQILISSITAGAVIAFAEQKLLKRNG